MRQSQDALQAAFDGRADSYVGNRWHVQYAQRLVQLAAVQPGARVLDAATGTGFAAFAAADAVGPSGQVVAVDISAGMLDKARQVIAASGLTNVELVQADATCLDRFPDASFDLVLCSAGLLYMPVHAALREWHRLLTNDGRVGFSTMQEGFPVAARLFRQHAASFGLSLTDPAAPLGDVERCHHVLCEAGFVPDEVIVESIRFSRTDLDHAWEAHVQGSYHEVVDSLDPVQVKAFRAAYTTDLNRLLEVDEDSVRDAQVIYAFGRKHSLDR